MDPQNCCVLIPGAWEYVTLCGKRNFADVIMIEDLKMGRLFWIILLGLA